MELILGNHFKNGTDAETGSEYGDNSVAQSAAVLPATSWLTTSLRR